MLLNPVQCLKIYNDYKMRRSTYDAVLFKISKLSSTTLRSHPSACLWAAECGGWANLTPVPHGSSQRAPKPLLAIYNWLNQYMQTHTVSYIQLQVETMYVDAHCEQQETCTPGIENIGNIYCHSLSVQYNTTQCYLSTECIQNQFLFLKDCTSKHVGPIVSYKGF